MSFSHPLNRRRIPPYNRGSLAVYEYQNTSPAAAKPASGAPGARASRHLFLVTKLFRSEYYVRVPAVQAAVALRVALVGT